MAIDEAMRPLFNVRICQTFAAWWIYLRNEFPFGTEFWSLSGEESKISDVMAMAAAGCFPGSMFPIWRGVVGCCSQA